MLPLFQRIGRFGHIILLVLQLLNAEFLVSSARDFKDFVFNNELSKHSVLKFKCSTFKGTYKVKNHK